MRLLERKNLWSFCTYVVTSFAGGWSVLLYPHLLWWTASLPSDRSSGPMRYEPTNFALKFGLRSGNARNGESRIVRGFFQFDSSPLKPIAPSFYETVLNLLILRRDRYARASTTVAQYEKWGFLFLSFEASRREREEDQRFPGHHYFPLTRRDRHSSFPPTVANIEPFVQQKKLIVLWNITLHYCFAARKNWFTLCGSEWHSQTIKKSSAEKLPRISIFWR